MKIAIIGACEFMEENDDKYKYSTNPWTAIEPVLKDADVVCMNLHTVITNSNTKWGSGPNENLKIESGYNRGGEREMTQLRNIIPNVEIYCALANSHTLDYGIRGMKNTISVLGNLGIRHAGAGVDRIAAKTPARGNILFFSATSVCICCNRDQQIKWGASNSRGGAYWVGIREGEYDFVIEDIENIRKNDSAITIVFSIHFGLNWHNPPRLAKDMRHFAMSLIDAGVDIVFGHGAHHILPVERYNGGIIINALGDMVNTVVHKEQSSTRHAMRADLSAILMIENKTKITVFPVWRPHGNPQLLECKHRNYNKVCLKLKDGCTEDCPYEE